MAAAALRKLFAPKSIAIVGASRRATSHSARLLRNIDEYGYRGQVHLVNPSGADVDGRATVRAVADLPEGVDLALVLVPAADVSDAVRKCAERGIGAAVVYSSGFADDRGEEGTRRQRELADVIRETDIRVCGPNAEGFLNLGDALPASFSGNIFKDRVVPHLGPPTLAGEPAGPAFPAAAQGSVAIVAQSGGLGFSLFNRGLARGLGFSYVISAGNEVDLEILDYLDFLVDDPGTSVILAYLEGLHNPGRLQSVLAKAERRGTSLVVAKVGHSRAAQRAVLSHTGHLAGDDAAYDAVFDRYGVVRVTDPDEMLDVALALSTAPKPRGNRVGVVSFSGGSAVWLADACAAQRLEVPELSADVQQRLQQVLPSFAATGNPVDISGASQVGPVRVLSMIADEPDIDSLVLISTLGSVGLDAERETLQELSERTDKPIIVYSYTEPGESSKTILRELKLPWFTSPERCARALGALTAVALHESEGAGTQFGAEDWRRPAPADDAPDPVVLSEFEAKTVLGAAGLPITREVLVSSAVEAAAAAEQIGFPVALKIQSPDIPHKARVGGVVLDLASAGHVTGAFDRLQAVVKESCPDAVIEGTLVQEMMPPGLELILGMQTSSGLGPMVLIGLGGVFAEVLGKTVLYPAPFGTVTARRLLLRLGVDRLLAQTGAASDAITPIAEVVARLSRLAATAARDIIEMDLNPVVLDRTTGRPMLVDALIVARGAAGRDRLHAGSGRPLPDEKT